jgi:uncharacterized membrane protein YqjE
MDLRTLESLRNAIPVVLRHLDAYVELAEQDFAQAKSAAASRLRIAALFGVSAFITLLLACGLVVALAWDTPYRIWAISGLTLLFAATAIGTATALTRKRESPFASLKREWKEDRELFRSFLTKETTSEPQSKADDSEFAKQREGEPVWLHR